MRGARLTWGCCTTSCVADQLTDRRIEDNGQPCRCSQSVGSLFGHNLHAAGHMAVCCTADAFLLFSRGTRLPEEGLDTKSPSPVGTQPQSTYLDQSRPRSPRLLIALGTTDVAFKFIVLEPFKKAIRPRFCAR